MELTHSFTVPATLEETWKAFNDIEDVAGCFPGATVTSVEGDDFKGSAKVKLGPIALVYTGTGRFLERDEATHRFVLEAKGRDKRGNGTASAVATAVMSELSSENTAVEVTTDLAITGKPAQFGRGVVQDVSDKLLQQFMDCLEGRVGAAPAAAAPAPGEGPSDASRPAAQPPPAEDGARPEAAPVAAPHEPDAGRWRAEQVEAIDLGSTVVPVVLKTYWKQIAAVALVLFVLRWLSRRRGR